MGAKRSNTVKYTNRELSWLAFNERVLMEATDKKNPLLERLKFLSIFSSNLDEFFMVRVSSLYDLIEAGYTAMDASGRTPLEQLKEIYAQSTRLTNLQQKIFKDLKDELKKGGILFPDTSDPEFTEVLKDIFVDEVMSVVTPVTLDPSHPFPFIYSRRLCLIAESAREGKEFVSLIMIPETLKRVYRVRKGKTVNIFTVEDIIKAHLGLLLKGYEVKSASLFRVTRDAELEVKDEDSTDLLKSIEHLLSERKRGDANRVEVSSDMRESTLAFLMEKVGFEKTDVYTVSGALDLTFLFSLSDLTPALSFPALKQRPVSRVTGETQSIFELVREKPLYFFRPYNSFSLVREFIAEAAKDEHVLAIKMTLYRTNKNSNIIASLLDAAKRGKQVSVVVELKARFDEERNIEWAKNLEQAGCIVTYGIVGLKIHAKCALVVRREGDRIVRYTHVATGNYNELTANIYTDIDLITADDDMGRDAAQLFNYLMGFTEETHWRKMKVAPFLLRQEVLSMIDKEIAFAKDGKSAEIIMKVNSLIDREVIDKLYAAGDAGVEVNLIVRGICGLRPQVKGLSERIKVRSIVGRFLEHARILYFKHNKTHRYFISSADMMPRNLNGRVELMVEVTDEGLKKSLKHFLDISLRDNTKSWELKGNKYAKLAPGKGEKQLNSQEYFLQNEI